MGQQSWFIGSLLTPNICVYIGGRREGGRRRTPPKASPKPPQTTPHYPRGSPEASRPQKAPSEYLDLPKACQIFGDIVRGILKTAFQK